MPSSRKRLVHILLGAVKPTMNMVIGIFIGMGRWPIAIAIFVLYLFVAAFADLVYWDSMDEAMKDTRKRLEDHLLKK